MLSSILYFVLLLSLTVLLILLIALIPHMEEKRREKQKRKTLRRKVSQFRLNKMLAYLGVNIDHYINKIPAPVIAKHIANCKACPNIPTCDECLRDGRIISDMNFCPNHQSLIALSRVLAEPSGRQSLQIVSANSE